MAAPIWKTPKGTLGTIQEQEFYELSLQAIVPDDATPSLNYKIIAGELPPGIIIDEFTGYINGRPKDIYGFKGVPFDVAQDTTSTFCCRVTNLRTNQVADRTFSLTITGQDAPTIVATVQELGKVFDGTYVSFQITAIDLDREALTYYVSKGALPEGLTLNSSTGIITGLIEPTGLLDFNALAGWSTESGWDNDPWDFGSRAVSKRFEFDISVTDNKDTVSRTFSIFVVSKNSLTADNEFILINGYHDFITADLDEKRNPVFTTPSTNLGTYAHDNYFAYQFTAKDFDYDQISFSLLVSENIGFDNETSGFDSTLLDMGNFELPPGLTLSDETGWLYGNIPAMTPVQKEYSFNVYVYKRNYPTYKSPLTKFTITIIGDLRNAINWITNEDLGLISAGAVSELTIEAANSYNKTLIYSLQPGKSNRLPQGLKLLNNGLISGRSSFEVTSFDQNSLTFDKNRREAGTLSVETIFDRDYTFTVRVNDIGNTLIAYKTFKVRVIVEYNQPYESLYLRAHPGINDKEIFNQLVNNSDLIPEEYVYRNNDPYFGKQKYLDVLLISGIKPSTGSEYIQAMAINHYRKKLLIGLPEVAQALDSNGNVKYEVLYLPMQDDNSSISKSIDLRNKINNFVRVDDNLPSIDSGYVTVNNNNRIVYPNSLNAMRSQIKTSLGYVDREILPPWMTSKQQNGLIPYWNPAMVLAYLKPGTGNEVKFLINRLFEYDLKDISFDVDRYIWDCNLSSTYDAVNDDYLLSTLTTFDSDVRQGSDTLVYSFIGDGSTTQFDFQIQISTGTLTVNIESYIETVGDSGLVFNRNTQVENVDYDRSGSSIIFNIPPVDNSTVVVEYTSNILLEADYAVTVPFNHIDGMPSTYITNVLDGLDQIITPYIGNLIIFARQEQYPGYIGPNDGWVQNNNTWDDGTYWDDPILGFDDYRVIPGYNENQEDPLIANERAGIWEITIDDLGLLRLQPVAVSIPGQRIYIKDGAFYGGKIVRYGPLTRFDIGETVPSYTIISQRDKGIATIFDGNSTRFVTNINVYQDPDEGDKYLVFPRVHIFA